MVYVLAMDGTPIMPTRRHGKIRHLLKAKKAKVVKRTPFTVQLLYESDTYTQPVTLGVDAGSQHIGLSATTKEKELYAAEVELRTDMNKNYEKRPLIVIGGPTATGKSELAAELGRRIHGEVISADSMQVYKYMDIGSAKVTLEEMLGVPHHMIDVLEPTEEMDVARYAEMVQPILEGIYSRGHVPILCGGTGFYIQAVTRGIDFTETSADMAFRGELQREAETIGNEALHDRLKEVDPEAAEAIHPNNVRRVIRALEFYRETGEKISDHNEKEQQKESPYRLAFFFLDDERPALYERIDRRVDFMMETGLADEVAFLMAMGLTREHVSMQGIGYKEILAAYEGEYSMEEAVRIIKRDSRHYAKRQETWFKREKDAVRLMRSDFDNDTFRILDEMIRIVKEKTGIEAEEVGNPYE